jgi:hypothetical protein
MKTRTVLPNKIGTLASDKDMREASPQALQPNDVRDQSSPLAEAHLESSDRERLWKYLVMNITRSVDELFVLCREEKSCERCQSSIDLLAQSQIRFNQLISQLQTQEPVPVALDAEQSVGQSPAQVCSPPF